ncbi:MAG: PH domain-containing protein [Verrucomicrobiota bacterium]|jgi:hypothetical protein
MWLNRAGWLAGLGKKVIPLALRGCTICGGRFSLSSSGFYYNKRLGSYRAYVTDPRHTVVLRYAKRRVVLSPAAPEDFVHDLALSNR